jgi:hypothetical protein
MGIVGFRAALVAKYILRSVKASHQGEKEGISVLPS